MQKLNIEGPENHFPGSQKGTTTVALIKHTDAGAFISLRRKKKFLTSADSVTGDRMECDGPPSVHNDEACPESHGGNTSQSLYEESFHMPDEINLRSLLSSRKILLDTSFAMHPGFGRFTATFGSTFNRNPILIPAHVLWELRKKSRIPASCLSARAALKQVARLIQSQQAEVRCECCDRFVDLVILRVTLQHMLVHDMVVLTNDCDLMLDLRANWERKSVQTHRTLEVLKFRGRTSYVCVFADEKAKIMTHRFG